MGFWISSGKNLAVHQLGDLLLQATSSRAISESEWLAYIDEVDRVLKSQRIVCSLQYSLTQGPPASIRKKISKQLGPNMFPWFVLISDSAFVRGILKAISWLLPNTKTKVSAYSPGQEKIGLAELAEHRPFDIDAAYAALDELVQAIGYPPIAR